MKNTTKLPLSTKFAFAVGQGSESLYTAMTVGFVMIFYNQGLMLRADLIGAGLLLATAFDAVSDPVIGSISDRLRSRWGRRHPFLFFSPLPLAVSIFYLFSPPQALMEAVNDGGLNGQLMMFGWMAAWLICGRMFLTMFNIPHLSLGAELSSDYQERTSLFSLNILFGGVSMSIFAFLAWRVFFSGETIRAVDGKLVPAQLDPSNYLPLVMWVAGVILACGLLSAYFTKNRIPYLSEPPLDNSALTLKSLCRDFSAVFSNSSYRCILIGLFCIVVTMGIGESVNPFMAVFFWQLDGEQIAWFGMAMLIGIIIGSISIPIAVKYVEKRRVAVCCVSTFAFLVPLPVLMHYLGLVPAEGSDQLLYVLLFQACLCSTCIAGLTVCVMSMLGDIADQIEFEFGRRQEGILFSARLFFSKLSMSLAYFVGGLLLEHYILLPVGAKADEISSDVLFKLGVVAGPLAALGAIFAIFAYGGYSLTRNEHSKIQKELFARHKMSLDRKADSNNRDQQDKVTIVNVA